MHAMHTTASGYRRELFVGLLDIFGSEARATTLTLAPALALTLTLTLSPLHLPCISQVLGVNGFEQLMINYANDKLQYFFTQTAISLVLAEYREQVRSRPHLPHISPTAPP